MSNRTKKVAASTAAAAALLATQSQSTEALFGSVTSDPTTGVYLTANDEQWTVWAVALEDVTAWNVGWHVGNTYGNTDLDPVWTYPGGNDCLVQPVDLCIYDSVQPVSMNWYARTDCVGTISGIDPGAVCSKVRIRFNLRVGPGFVPGVANSSYNACHELGHSIGLQHPFDSATGGGLPTCMHGYGPPGGGGLSMTFIRETEKDEINAHYK